MDLMTVIERLASPNIDRLVKLIDRDWFLNNINGELMGISNKRFLCNYIEDNMNKNIPLMQDGDIQDILLVHKFDYKNLKTLDISKIQNLPKDYKKIYYSLIGRIDPIKTSIVDFIINLDFYRGIISQIFNNVQLTDYRVYSLCRLLGGLGLFIEFAREIDPRLTLLFMYENSKNIDILIDYHSSWSRGNAGMITVFWRFLAITTLLTDDLDNFKDLYEKNMTTNNLHQDVDSHQFYNRFLILPTTLPTESGLIKIYGTDLMALISALGKLEFLKYLISRGDWRYKLVELIGANNTETSFSNLYGSRDVRQWKNKEVLIPKYFKQSADRFITYLGISLWYRHYTIADYMINNGYPIQDDDAKFYDIMKELELHIHDDDGGELLQKYKEYIYLNRALIEECIDDDSDDDKIRSLAKRGSNLNVMYRPHEQDVLTLLQHLLIIDSGYAELLLQLGANVNYRNPKGGNCAFFIYYDSTFDLCKKYGVDFKMLDYNDNTCLVNIFMDDEDEEKLKLTKLIIDEGADINQRNKTQYESFGYRVASSNSVASMFIIEQTNLDIINNDGLDAFNQRILYDKVTEYVYGHGTRGVLSYKRPMFYLPKKNSDCPNEETVGLVDVNNPEDDIIIMFRDMSYSDITHRHNQEPMCIALSEIPELYFKLRPGTEEFEWNLPTTRNTHRLGFEQVQDDEVLRDFMTALRSVNAELPETDPRKNKLREVYKYIQDNVDTYLKPNTNYYNQNIAVFKRLNENQLKLLETLMLMVFKLGEFMRRWGVR